MDKPKCKLIGEDGNIFNLLAIVAKALRRAGQRDKASEVVSRVFDAKSYEDALAIFQEYVEVC